MSADTEKLEPAFDFTTDEPSILLHQYQAEVHINQNIYTGNGEVRLELLPRAHIYLYGYFQGVSPKDIVSASIGQIEISSFSINSRRIEGFLLSSGGNIKSGGDIKSQEFNVKWCPRSEPINGIGDESTQVTRLVFHLFNFVDLFGTRHSREQSGSTYQAIEHLDLVYNDLNVELKSLLSTRENIKTLKEEGGYRITDISLLCEMNDEL